jgi:hypothetical protein
MSQLTSQAPPGITDGTATVAGSASGSPDPYKRLRMWARFGHAFQEMTHTPTCPGGLQIRWP